MVVQLSLADQGDFGNVKTALRCIMMIPRHSGPLALIENEVGRILQGSGTANTAAL